MLISVRMKWEYLSSPLGFPRYRGEGVAFNTDTKQMEPAVDYFAGAFLQPPPPDIWYNDGAPFYWDCDNYAPGSDPKNYSATIYYYKRDGDSFFTQREDNVVYCGYNPPDTKTCKIIVDSVSVNYDEATVQCSGYVGPLQYSLDGGVNRQTENVFKELSEGEFTASVYDLGATLQKCFNTKKFTVSGVPPTGAVATVASLPLFCFAGNPVVLDVHAAVPYHQVITQVWVEKSHRSGAYYLAYESQRRSDSAGQVQLDVSDILRAQVQNRLDLSSTWRQLDKAALNWFVRVADVLPQNGKPGTWATSNNSVVMFGGLAPEPLLAKADYWNSARVGRLFHTWQPVTKRIGPQHVEVLQYLQPDALNYTVRVKWFDGDGQALPTRGLAAPAPPSSAPAVNAVVPPPLDPAQRVRFYQVAVDAKEFYGASQLVVDVVETPASPAGLDTAPGLCYARVYNVAMNTQPRQLIYQNSVGGHDTLALFGKMSGKLSLDPSPVDSYLANTSDQATTRLLKSWPGTPSTPGYSLATGWLSADWLEYMQEVVQPGRDVYEYVARQLRPVVLTTKELVTYQEIDGLTGATLEYKPALVNEYFSDYARNTNQAPTIGIGW